MMVPIRIWNRRNNRWLFLNTENYRYEYIEEIKLKNKIYLEEGQLPLRDMQKWVLHHVEQPTYAQVVPNLVL